jgi:hypothetical protein
MIVFGTISSNYSMLYFDFFLFIQHILRRYMRHNKNKHKKQRARNFRMPAKPQFFCGTRHHRLIRLTRKTKRLPEAALVVSAAAAAAVCPSRMPAVVQPL